MEEITKEMGITSGDVARRVMDFGLHIWTSHHPYYIPEPFTLEPTESPTRADLDEYTATLHHILNEAYENPDMIRDAPHNSTTHQTDESSVDDPAQWCPTWRVYLRKTQEA